MREVAPGDIVFSYAGGVVAAIGVARSFAYEAPKPAEFGSAGPNWSRIGWRVDVLFHELDVRVKPSEYADRIVPLLPTRYSPLSQKATGLQSVYLTLVPNRLADALVGLIGEEARNVRAALDDRSSAFSDSAVGLAEWEQYLSDTVAQDMTIEDSERKAIILARRGQGKFKSSVLALEGRCRITGVDRVEHLRASHIKPWRDCSTAGERLDGENGFLMTPSIDHLFDRGFISFDSKGQLLISPIAHRQSLLRMGVDVERQANVGRFSSGQNAYLEYHRDQVFLQAKIRL